jgi:hypothetical protein
LPETHTRQSVNLALHFLGRIVQETGLTVKIATPIFAVARLEFIASGQQRNAQLRQHFWQLFATKNMFLATLIVALA